MFTVTEKALEVIKDFVKEKKADSAVRITLAMGCSGPALGMALDDPRNDDEVFDEKGTKFVIEKDIYNQAKPIHVDFVDTPHGSGFKLTSALSAASDGCGSCCNC
ncbi:MAG TPA: IscA/HesB family protein [Smithella sp.]|nr:IscA/HesB family protein [Smithella sp.]